MRWLLAVLLFGFGAINSQLQFSFLSGFDTNLRGVSAIPAPDSTDADAAVIWMSGSNGIILQWKGLGTAFKRLPVPDGDALDFRGIRAVSEKTAYLMSSGEGDKSRIYKTTDGGQTWKLQYTDKRPAFFLDALVCVSQTECFALGDPIDGKFVLLHTGDGEHWNAALQEALPPALPGEGAFAASNTSLAICGPDVYFGTGGAQAARVFHSADRGKTWKVKKTPMASGSASTGIFSVACAGDRLVVVGGDYKDPNRVTGVAVYSSNRGKSWHLAEAQPGGYRSSVVWVNRTNLIAVGPNGADFSEDSGGHWFHSDLNDFNAIATANKKYAWAVGAKGAIARIDIPR